jgi:hypothetical protein
MLRMASYGMALNRRNVMQLNVLHSAHMRVEPPLSRPTYGETWRSAATEGRAAL